jgi:proline iminopeptidase
MQAMSISSAPHVHRAPPRGAGWLAVGAGHVLRWWSSGARDGVPVVLLHGGPGSGSSPRLAAPFNLRRWRIVRFDQRGCGRSTPLGATYANDTAALVDDIDALRVALGIDTWVVAGGSWGAALALAYAVRHRRRVRGLLLRSPFLTGRVEIEAFFAVGKTRCPAEYAALECELPRASRRGMAAALDRVFAAESEPELQWRVACAWQRYESRFTTPAEAPPAPVFGSMAAARLVAKYRVQAHYLARECFCGEAQLLRAARSLSGLPVAIVHGNEDLICPVHNAERLHAACRGSRLVRVAGAGHNPYHPELLRATRALSAEFLASGAVTQPPATMRDAQ